MASRAELEALRMANQQRERATLDKLTKKRRVEKVVVVNVPGDDGPEQLELLFRSIGSQEYDQLITKFPPTQQQKKENLSYDIDRFAPALISRVCVDPDMSEEDTKAIWTSDEWNRGELMDLFLNAIEVCTRGLEVNPTESD
jgi:hypothetical protein